MTDVTEELVLVCYDCRQVTPLSENPKKDHPDKSMKHHTVIIHKNDPQAQVFKSKKSEVK